MKNISDFHYNSDYDDRYLWDFCLKSWTKVVLSRDCKLWLSKRVIPAWTEVILVWEEPDWDKRKKVVLEIKWEKIEISTNILLDSELFREMVKISSWRYKISKVSDLICNQVKSWFDKKKEKWDKHHKKHEDKKHSKDEKEHIHIWKKAKKWFKEFFKKLWFWKQKD